MDPSLHPKYNAITGKIETRGQKAKPLPEQVHWKTQMAREAAAPKLIEVIMRSFLRAWTENEDPTLRASKQNFYNYGCGAEIIEMWLGESKDEGIKGVDIGKIIKQKRNWYFAILEERRSMVLHLEALIITSTSSFFSSQAIAESNLGIGIRRVCNLLF
ncbi:hypothetical protein BDZ91DRAFT_786779 [Kalaharituber pfeilii]|nr:hypothetical protein BDZ91DRAFT_786779 [Kalaharituber pfeilii]